MNEQQKMYLQYFTEWNEAETPEDKAIVNQGWFIGKGGYCFSKVLVDCNLGAGDLFPIESDEEIARKQKTQIINGHEVIAPRYDEPSDRFFMFSAISENGIAYIKHNSIDDRLRMVIKKYGWFDNESDAIAYAKAHEGIKNE